MIIEIDGVTHNDKQSYDKRRENRLRELGFNILRVDGYDVINNIHGILETIMAYINEIDRDTSP